MPQPESTRETIIRIPGIGRTGYRAYSGTLDPETEKEITSHWYSDINELMSQWSDRGFRCIESIDNRILVLEQLTEQLRTVFEASGTPGVTEKLAQIEFKRARDALEDIQIEYEAVLRDRPSESVQFAFRRSLECDPIAHTGNDKFHFVGVEFYVQFPDKFPSSGTDEVPPEAKLLNEQFRISYSVKNGFTPSLSSSPRQVIFNRFTFLMDVGGGKVQKLPVPDEETFNVFIAENKAAFRSTKNLPSTGHSIILHGAANAGSGD